MQVSRGAHWRYAGWLPVMKDRRVFPRVIDENPGEPWSNDRKPNFGMHARSAPECTWKAELLQATQLRCFIVPPSHDGFDGSRSSSERMLWSPPDCEVRRGVVQS